MRLNTLFSCISQKYIDKLFLDNETIIYFNLVGLFAIFPGIFAAFLRISGSFCIFPGLFASLRVFLRFPVFRQVLGQNDTCHDIRKYEASLEKWRKLTI